MCGLKPFVLPNNVTTVLKNFFYFYFFWYFNISYKLRKSISIYYLRYNYLYHILTLFFLLLSLEKKKTKPCVPVGVLTMLRLGPEQGLREWAFVSFPFLLFSYRLVWLLLPSLCHICGQNNPLEKWRIAWPLIYLCPESAVTKLMKSREKGPSAKPVNSKITVCLILFWEYRLSFC
jgi:hypothetical protein